MSVFLLLISQSLKNNLFCTNYNQNLVNSLKFAVFWRFFRLFWQKQNN